MFPSTVCLHICVWVLAYGRAMFSSCRAQAHGGIRCSGFAFTDHPPLHCFMHRHPLGLLSSRAASQRHKQQRAAGGLGVRGGVSKGKGAKAKGSHDRGQHSSKAKMKQQQHGGGGGSGGNGGHKAHGKKGKHGKQVRAVGRTCNGGSHGLLRRPCAALCKWAPTCLWHRTAGSSHLASHLACSVLQHGGLAPCL